MQVSQGACRKSLQEKLQQLRMIHSRFLQGWSLLVLLRLPSATAAVVAAMAALQQQCREWLAAAAQILAAVREGCVVFAWMLCLL
jgi:hypothetical protein